jgi:ATP-dependent Clp protease ATP-binding subunit ClpA
MNPMNAIRDMRTIKQLLTDAEAVARAMGDEMPGAEHLLLAAMDLPDGSAPRMLDRFGVDRERLRAAIVEQHGAALAEVGIPPELGASPALEPAPSRLYHSAPSAQEAFQAASTLARGSRERLSGAHVVAAVAGMEHGTAARTLELLGIDRAALANAAHAEQGSR